MRCSRRHLRRSEIVKRSRPRWGRAMRWWTAPIGREGARTSPKSSPRLRRTRGCGCPTTKCSAPDSLTWNASHGPRDPTRVSEGEWRRLGSFCERRRIRVSSGALASRRKRKPNTIDAWILRSLRSRALVSTRVTLWECESRRQWLRYRLNIRLRGELHNAESKTANEGWELFD